MTNRLLRNGFEFVFLPIILIFILYYPVFNQLNDVLLNGGKDSYRAYFVYINYIQGNSPWLHFNMLNFPYGENIFYLDCNPLLMFISRILFSFFPFLNSYAIAVFNITPFLNLWVGYIFLISVFKELKVNRMFSIIGALLIIFLSPQLLKIAGNYSLAYVQYIPMMVFFMLKYYANNHWKNVIALIGINLTALLTHPYLGVMTSGFSALYFGLSLFESHQLLKKRFNYFLSLILSSLVPTIIYLLLVKFSDDHSSRTESPGGYMENYLPVYELLVQPFGLTGLWTQKLFPKANANWFDSMYIPFVFILIFIIGLVYHLKHKNKTGFNKSLIFMVLSSLSLLVFATGIFGLTKFSWLYEWIVFARQFRFVNRFAWAFYYVFAIVSVVLIYDFYKSISLSKWYKWVILITISIYAIVDMLMINIKFSQELIVERNIFKLTLLSQDELDAINKINHSQYEFILPLPLPLEGSFHFSGPYSDIASVNSYKYSWHTQLPILGGILIRPDENKANWVRQAINLSFYSSPLDSLINPNKKVLIIQDPIIPSELTEEFINRADRIQSFTNYFLYSMNNEEFVYNSSCDTILKYDQKNLNSSFLNVDSSCVYYNYDLFSSDQSHSGKGALRLKRGVLNIIHKLESDNIKNEEFIASCWVYNKNENSVNGCFLVQEINEDGTPGEWINFSNPARSEIVYNNWSLTSIQFKIEKNKKYQIALTAYDHSELDFIIDDFLLRPVGSVYLKKMNNHELMYNTHFIQCID